MTLGEIGLIHITWLRFISMCNIPKSNSVFLITYKKLDQ